MKNKDKKYIYRVKSGRMFGAFNQHGPGSLVELTEDEAGGFLDKLELVRDDDVNEKPSYEEAFTHLNSLTVNQLKNLDEYQEFDNPKPTLKAEIIEAVLAARGLKE
jgi:hypothetical protein